MFYLDIKGFAEPIRLCFVVGKVEFEDKRVTYDEITTMRSNGELPFSQVPVLRIDDGDGSLPQSYGQTTAILRWAGVKTGLYKHHLQLKIDTMLEAFADIHKALVPAWYRHACGRSPITGEMYEKTKLTSEQYTAVLEALSTEILPFRFELIEKCHNQNFGSPQFLCDHDLTIADLVLYTLVTGIQDGSFCDGLSTTAFPTSKCPKLMQIVQRIDNIEEVKLWNQVVTVARR